MAVLLPGEDNIVIGAMALMILLAFALGYSVGKNSKH
jgi:hypothetical protein